MGAYDLMTQTMQFAAHISKNVSNPLGVRIKELTYQLCYDVRVLYEVPNRDAHIDKALELCSEIKFALQVLKDLKEISVNTFALASERVVSCFGLSQQQRWQSQQCRQQRQLLVCFS